MLSKHSIRRAGSTANGISRRRESASFRKISVSVRGAAKFDLQFALELYERFLRRRDHCPANLLMAWEFAPLGLRWIATSLSDPLT